MKFDEWWQIDNPYADQEDLKNIARNAWAMGFTEGKASCLELENIKNILSLTSDEDLSKLIEWAKENP